MWQLPTKGSGRCPVMLTGISRQGSPWVRTEGVAQQLGRGPWGESHTGAPTAQPLPEVPMPALSEWQSPGSTAPPSPSLPDHLAQGLRVAGISAEVPVLTQTSDERTMFPGPGQRQAQPRKTTFSSSWWPRPLLAWHPAPLGTACAVGQPEKPVL